MNRIIGIAVLAVGVVLVVWGLNASDSLGSGISRIFAGAPTDKTLCLLVAGGLLAAVGLGSIFYPGRKAA